MIKEELMTTLDNCIRYYDANKIETSFMHFLRDVNIDLFVIVGLDKNLQEYIKNKLNNE